MDKVLNKSRSMLFRKRRGKDDAESISDSQYSENGRGMHVASGSLDRPVVSDSTKGIMKSAISSPTEIDIHHHVSMSTPGYPRSAHLGSNGNPAQPVSDIRKTWTTLRNHDYGPHTIPMTHRNVINSLNPSPSFASVSESSARVQGRSQSALASSEASSRSRRHGMHLHSLGNVVTMIESGSRPTLETSIPREQGGFSQTFMGQPSSPPAPSCLRDADKGPSQRVPSKQAPAHLFSTKEIGKTQSITGTQIQTDRISIPTTQFLSQYEDGKRCLINSSSSKPPSSFLHDRFNSCSTYSTHNTSFPLAQCERSLPAGNKENSLTFSNSSAVSPDQQFMITGARNQRPKPVAYDQQSISGNNNAGTCVDNQDSQVRAWEDYDDQHSMLSYTNPSSPIGESLHGDKNFPSTAKDRLLREINKMHGNPVGGGPQDSKTLDWGSISQLDEQTINSMQPGPRSKCKESTAFNPKEMSSRSNVNASSDSEHQVDLAKLVQAGRESFTRSPNSQDTAPSSASLPTPPPSSTTLSFLANQLDMANILPLHNIGTSAMQHDVVPCVCKECNHRISQLEREVTGLRCLLLEIVKLPDNHTRDSLVRSLHGGHSNANYAPNVSEVWEPIQRKNPRTDTPSSYSPSLGDPSLRLVSYFEDDEDDLKHNFRPLKLMRRKGNGTGRSKSNASDRKPRGLW